MDFILSTQWQDFDNPMNDLLDEIDTWWVSSPPPTANDTYPGMPIFPLYCEVLPEKGKIAKGKILSVNRSPCPLIDLPPQIVAVAQEYLANGISLTGAIFKPFPGNRIGAMCSSEGHATPVKFNRTMEMLVKEAKRCVLKDSNGNDVFESGKRVPRYKAIQNCVYRGTHDKRRTPCTNLKY